MSDKEELGFWKSMFNKTEAISHAENYAHTPFYKKSKNIIIFFYLFIITIGFLLESEVREVSPSFDAYYILIWYLIFLPFVFLNHRWSMILLCVFYVIDRILALIMGFSNPITMFFFSIINISLTYYAVMTATHLKKLKQGK